MRIFGAMEASASALTAERLRMDVIAHNLANMNTTRTDSGGPYRRRTVTLAERTESFKDVLDRTLAGGQNDTGAGVKVVSIGEDRSAFKLKYDPGHPDADASGYVRLPNVDMLTEMTDMMVANRSYEANVTAFNAAKALAMKALEIGR